MIKKWRIYNNLSNETVFQLQKELRIEKLIAKMLSFRGIKTKTEALNFFEPDLNHLHDPFLMKGMNSAVDRLSKALNDNEKILIYGDYDVDGTTSVALVYDFLKKYTDNICYYIPDRYDEGYGLSKKAIDFANNQKVNLIITLDCGIRAIENIALGTTSNIDFIVCDHHNPGEILPDAIILNPKQKDCNYPYKELCGCGVGFKLLSALCQQEKRYSIEVLFEYLDLVAIAIGADIVPITGENRTLCYFGLQKINSKPRLGIAKILELAKRPVPLTLTDIVFVIAPRINAAGRMLHAEKGVELLISKDDQQAFDLAETIHTINSERKKTDEEITALALEQIDKDDESSDKSTNVVYGQGWHKGVVGIVASRIIENYYKPTVVLTQTEEDGLYTGSARSVDGVNIYNALEKCSDLFEKFGGHAHAAGLSIQQDNLALFRKRFDEEVKKQIGAETLIPELKIESEISFNDIFKPGESINKLPRIKKILERFEPCGPGNMKPVFSVQNVYISQFKKLKDIHFKLWLKQYGFEYNIEAIMFNASDFEKIIMSNKPVSIAFTIESNKWNGREKVQLNLKDIRPQSDLKLYVN